MQSIPKDVKLYVYRLIHESFMKELIKEYHLTYYWSHYDALSSICDRSIVANYRAMDIILYVHNKVCKFDRSRKTIVYLPKRYYFSSGVNNQSGYRNMKSLIWGAKTVTI